MLRYPNAMLLSAGVLFVLVISASGQRFRVLSDDPCDVWAKYPPGLGIPKDPHFTINTRVPSQCTNGTFQWHYPRGHVMVHFPNKGRGNRTICFGDALGGFIFTVVDLTNGRNDTLPQLHHEWGPRTDTPKVTEICTKPTDSRKSLLRVDAPPTQTYMGALTYDIKS